MMWNYRNRNIVLIGPTGSGKTLLAQTLAQNFKCTICNC